MESTRVGTGVDVGAGGRGVEVEVGLLAGRRGRNKTWPVTMYCEVRQLKVITSCQSMPTDRLRRNRLSPDCTTYCTQLDGVALQVTDAEVRVNVGENVLVFVTVKVSVGVAVGAGSCRK